MKRPPSPPPPPALVIALAAADTLTQRGVDYDQPQGERSMTRTVAAFNALTGHNLSVVDGWQFMVLLKLVRGRTSPRKADNFVDAAAYAALAGEESTGGAA